MLEAGLASVAQKVCSLMLAAGAGTSGVALVVISSEELNTRQGGRQAGSRQ